MQAKDFNLLVSTGVIDHVTVWQNPKDAGSWSVFGYPRDGVELGRVNAVEAARGGVRTWASLDTVFAWLRSSGWSGEVNVGG